MLADAEPGQWGIHSGGELPLADTQEKKQPIPGETEINRARLLAHMIMNIRPALGTTPAITLNAPDLHNTQIHFMLTRYTYLINYRPTLSGTELIIYVILS